MKMPYEEDKLQGIEVDGAKKRASLHPDARSRAAGTGAKPVPKSP